MRWFGLICPWQLRLAATKPWDQSGRTRIWAVPDAGCSDDMNALALFGN
tara:strand:- start:19746 stop:19892 length:147 start_codon:yes stop_codon:yes gene_type:complete